MEEEQAGLCEPGRNDEDPCSFVVTLRCKRSVGVVGILEQWPRKKIEYE